MKVIYIDSLFFLNFIINYLLLLAGAKITGSPFSRWRLASGAAIGGAYAVLVWVPGMRFMGFWPMKIAVCLLMVLAAYAFSAKGYLIRLSITFVLISFALGGAVMALSYFTTGSAMNAGILYLSVDIKTLLITSGLSYGLLCLAFRKSGRHIGNELSTVVFGIGERKTSLTALKDSGHTLTDPLTGTPVLIAEARAVAGVLGFTVTPEMLLHPSEAVLKLSERGQNFRLIPYRAVGVECNFLLAFKPDYITVDKAAQKRMLIAISPTVLSEGGGYQALVPLLS